MLSTRAWSSWALPLSPTRSQRLPNKLLLVLAQGLQAWQRQILLQYSLLDDFHLEFDFIQLLGLLQMLLALVRRVLTCAFAIIYLLGILVSSTSLYTKGTCSTGSQQLLLFQGFSLLLL